MYQPANRFAAPPTSAQLRVPYASFDDAKREFPNCERVALRAFTRSEAKRLANALIRLPRWDQGFTNVVALFARDTAAVNVLALRVKRTDFVIMLMRSGRFERRIARRLVREGRLSKAVLS